MAVGDGLPGARPSRPLPECQRSASWAAPKRLTARIPSSGRDYRAQTTQSYLTESDNYTSIYSGRMDHCVRRAR